MAENNTTTIPVLEQDTELEFDTTPVEYMRDGYMIDPSTGHEIGTEPEEGGTGPGIHDIDELAKKLGVDPETLETVDEQTDSKAETDKSDGDSDKETEETEEAIKKRLATVDSELKALMGVGLQEVYGLINELADFRNQYYIDQQRQTLQKEWGDSYETNFKAVQEKWETLGEKQKVALNTPDGARLLLALIEKEANQKQTTMSRNNSAYVRSSGSSVNPGDSGGKKLRLSEIMKLSQEDYMKRNKEIETAFKQGRVIKDY